MEGSTQGLETYEDTAVKGWEVTGLFSMGLGQGGDLKKEKKNTFSVDTAFIWALEKFYDSEK